MTRPFIRRRARNPGPVTDRPYFSEPDNVSDRVWLLFPFIVQKTGREPAKLEIEVQVLVKGPLFPRVVKLQSCGASNAVLWVGVPPRGPLSPRGREAQASAF